MIVVRVYWGNLPLFFNFDCERFVFAFRVFLAEHHWHFNVYHNSAPVSTIDESAESIKTEMLGMFWDWMNQPENKGNNRRNMPPVIERIVEPSSLIFLFMSHQSFRTKKQY